MSDVRAKDSAGFRESGVAGEHRGAIVKKGWEIKRLDEVCTKIQDGAHRSPQVLHAQPGKGRFPYLTSKNIRPGYLKLDTVQYCEGEFHNDIYPRCNVELGDVLLTKDGANTGNVAINTLDKPFSLLSSVCLLKPDSAKVVSSFLCYYIQSDDGFSQITGKMTGAAIKRIILKTIKASSIPIPPLPEQQRIVGILDEAFAGIATAKANAEKNLKNARELFESELNGVFARRGDGWVERRLSELCDIKHGFAFKSEFFTNAGDYVVLTPGNFFESGGYRDRGEKQKFYCGELPNGFILEKGDLLVAMTEQAVGLLGSPVLIPESDRFLHNQRLGLITRKPGIPCANQFFFHAFNTQRVRQEIHDSASGVKVRHTSPKKIGDVVVSYPPSEAEQLAIARRLREVREETRCLESVYQRKLAALDDLKKSLLQQAFNGEL